METWLLLTFYMLASMEEKLFIVNRLIQVWAACDHPDAFQQSIVIHEAFFA